MDDKIITNISGVNIIQNYIPNLVYNKNLADRAKQKRKAGILSEVLFWKQVRAKSFYNLDFDRQRIIGNYIVDFYVKSLGLIIEIDGISHIGKEQYDAKRELFFKNLGIRVYRISDIDVKKNIQYVMSGLADYIINKFGEK